MDFLYCTVLLALVILERVENKIVKAGRDQIMEGLECQAMPNHSKIVVVSFILGGEAALICVLKKS